MSSLSGRSKSAHGLVLAVLIGLLLAIKVPKGSPPPTFFPLLYGSAIFLIIKSFQGDEIEAHQNSGGETYGFWRVAAITIVGTVLTFAAPYMIFLN